MKSLILTTGAGTIEVGGQAMDWFVRPEDDGTDIKRRLSHAFKPNVRKTGRQTFSLAPDLMTIDTSLDVSSYVLQTKIAEDNKDDVPWQWFIKSSQTFRTQRVGSVGEELLSGVPGGSYVGSVIIETSITPTEFLDLFVNSEAAKAGKAESIAKDRIEAKIGMLRDVAIKLDKRLIANICVYLTGSKKQIVQASKAMSFSTPTGVFAVGSNVASTTITSMDPTSLLQSYISTWDKDQINATASPVDAPVDDSNVTAAELAAAGDAYTGVKGGSMGALPSAMHPYDIYAWYTLLRCAFDKDVDINDELYKAGYTSVTHYLASSSITGKFVAINGKP